MRVWKIVFSAVLISLAFSDCGGGSANTNVTESTESCVETGYNPNVETNGVVTCVNAKSWSLPSLTDTMPMNLYVSINGQNAAYDVVIVQSVHSLGYFGSPGTTIQEVHLDANGTGQITYTPSSTGTDEITLKSTLLSNGTAAEQQFETTTLTVTIQ